MKTTIRDVAEAAGVSPMAVSVVLNGTGGNKITVSPEKADRIRRIARDLRYQPNRIARSLRNRTTNQVAVVFQHFFGIGPHNPYHVLMLNGVTTALFAQGYAMTLCPKMIIDGDVASISDGRFDGVLWCRPDFNEASLDLIRSSNTPVVMMHVPPGLASGIPTFCADNEGAMRRVVAHLKALGHKRLGFLIDPVSIRTVEGQVRSQALVTASQEAGLPKAEVIVLGDLGEAMARCAEPDSPHSAIVCFSDELAGFALVECDRLGIRVPEQFSLVGFDSSQFCETTKPRLTSVSQPVQRMAYEATNHLLSLIHADEKGQPRSPMASSIYDCGLDIRESTGPPPHSLKR
jgi:LacI family transcriptional regulator